MLRLIKKKTVKNFYCTPTVCYLCYVFYSMSFCLMKLTKLKLAAAKSMKSVGGWPITKFNGQLQIKKKKKKINVMLF